MAVDAGLTLRSPQVLAAQLETCDAEWRLTGRRFFLGAHDALRWLLGDGPAPIRQVGPCPRMGVCDIVAELAAAAAMIYGAEAEASGYARGVEHALMWARLVTPSPPVPIPRQATRSTQSPHAAHRITCPYPRLV